jgi:hypothetical protein
MRNVSSMESRSGSRRVRCAFCFSTCDTQALTTYIFKSASTVSPTNNEKTSFKRSYCKSSVLRQLTTDNTRSSPISLDPSTQPTSRNSWARAIIGALSKIGEQDVIEHSPQKIKKISQCFRCVLRLSINYKAGLLRYFEVIPVISITLPVMVFISIAKSYTDIRYRYR